MRLKPSIANASIFAPYPKREMTDYAIREGWFDGDFDRLDENYYHDSVLRFASETDKRRILNLRCFFSLLSRWPWLLPALRPLLDAPPTAAYRWPGDLVDGYFLKNRLPYRQSFGDSAA